MSMVISPMKAEDRRKMQALGLKNRKQLRKYRKKQTKARMQSTENK